MLSNSEAILHACYVKTLFFTNPQEVFSTEYNFSKNEGYMHSTFQVLENFREILNFQKTFRVTLSQKISGRQLCKFQFSVNIELSNYPQLDI